MQKESDDAKIEQRALDFHYAILRACDQAEIETKVSEIRQLRIQPNGNLAEEGMLEQIFKYILLMPLTKTPIRLSPNIFVDFKDKPQMEVVDKKMGMMFYPIKYTS